MRKTLNKILRFVISNEHPDGETSVYLTKKTIQLLFIHLFGIFMVFLSNYLFVKIAGVEVYGSYIYLFNFLYLLLAVAVPGTDTLLTKMTSVYITKKEYGKLKGIFLFSFSLTIFISLLCAIIANEFTESDIISKSGIDNWFVFIWFTLTIAASSQNITSSIQGMSRIIPASIPEKIIRPSFIILAICILYLIESNLSLNKLIYINLLSIILAAGAGIFILFRIIGWQIFKVRIQLEMKTWSLSSISFLLLSLFYILDSRISILLLGRITHSDQNIGVYNIALRVSEVISFVLLIIHFILSPYIAKLFANQEKEKLQRLVIQASRISFLSGLVAAVFIIVFSKTIMSFFGVNTLNGHMALIILSIAQVFNTVFGIFGTLLLMSGNQRYSMLSLIIGISLNISINVLLTPSMGITGTSIAAAISMISWNLLISLFAWKKLQINPLLVFSTKGNK